MENDKTNQTIPANGNEGTKKNEYTSRNIEKNTKQEGVKKGIIITSIIGIIILLVAFSLYNHEHKKLLSLMESQKVSFTDKVAARDSVINEWITTFDEIEKNIAMIKEKEKIISVSSSGSEMTPDAKTQVLEDIKYINTLLEQNKMKIASLTAQLKKSGGTIKALQSKVAELEASIKLNENEIEELKTTLVTKSFEIEQLNTQVTVMEDTIAKKEEIIVAKTNEMNKAFYICGTYKELKAKGLLTKEGGFVGIGRTESLTGNFSDDAFAQIDITTTKSIPVNSKGAKLISEHPDGSYEFIHDENKIIVSLEIKNPAQFWKISKYAVVETTK